MMRSARALSCDEVARTKRKKNTTCVCVVLWSHLDADPGHAPALDREIGLVPAHQNSELELPSSDLCRGRQVLDVTKLLVTQSEEDKMTWLSTALPTTYLRTRLDRHGGFADLTGLPSRPVSR